MTHLDPTALARLGPPLCHVHKLTINACFPAHYPTAFPDIPLAEA